jgi:hypothetical protein
VKSRERYHNIPEVRAKINQSSRERYHMWKSIVLATDAV